MDKRSSLLRLASSNGEKSFITLKPDCGSWRMYFTWGQLPGKDAVNWRPGVSATKLEFLLD
jgi:hypothetical protein